MRMRRHTARIALLLVVALAGCGGGEPETAVVRIEAAEDVCWSGAIGNATEDGCGNATFEDVDGIGGIYSANAQKQDDSPEPLTIILEVGGEVADEATTDAAFGVVQVVND